MATKKKLLQAAAGSAGGEALNVEDVFSTYLYEGFGTSTDKQIVNGVNLADEGGMVWIKSRTTTQDNTIFDTERGVHGYIVPNKTDAQYTPSGDRGLQSYNTDGFTIPSTSYFGGFDQASSDLASWTFRKAPKFFTCLTYTGTGPASGANEQQVSHDLGVKPAVVIIKRTDSTGDWWFFTDVIDGSNDYGYLNQTAAFGNSSNNVPTDSVFNVGGTLNVSGATYVAYLFAHNDGDGTFGPTGDQDIIKCGSYTGNGSSTGPEIDLGFEPQWLLIKDATSANNWLLFDNMRGLVTGGNDALLRPNLSDAELTSVDLIEATSTGFRIPTNDAGINGSGNTYIYIAIRRGPMAVPTDATDVFAIEDSHATSGSGPSFVSNFVTDMVLEKQATAVGDWYAITRLMGDKYVRTNSTGAELTGSATTWDYMNGAGEPFSSSPTFQGWMWKRAPSFFDVVAYTGNGTAGRTVSHNLGVVPEMMWIKNRDYTAGTSWLVYHKDLGGTKYLALNNANAAGTLNLFFNDTDPTSDVFTVGSGIAVNGSANNIIAYLFASLDGVSKVGSYTGTGATLNIDCGFSSGARFILIKRTDDSPYDWFVWDSERGIVAGNDPRLALNLSNAEVTTQDDIDPYSSGFTISSTSPGINTSGGSYIFYAIA